MMMTAANINASRAIAANSILTNRNRDRLAAKRDLSSGTLPSYQT